MERCTAVENRYSAGEPSELVGGAPLWGNHAALVGHVRCECHEGAGGGAAPDSAEVEAARCEELAVRKAPRSGRKRALQLRLRALIIAEVIAEADECS